ncbi:MAG: PIN domain-containing protein [Candidatus Bathyarchaeia archaeon]
MIIYVSDAVVFLHYLLDKLPPEADKAFREAEEGRAIIYLPTVAAELYYLFEKKGWMRQRHKLEAKMRGHHAIMYYPFNQEILSLFKETKAKEIYDKIIVSTAKLVGAKSLITNDVEITNLDEVDTLW